MTFQTIGIRVPGRLFTVLAPMILTHRSVRPVLDACPLTLPAVTL